MTVHPQPIGPFPEDTARVAKAAFPNGSTYIEIRNALESANEDEDLAALFEVRGRPDVAPAILGSAAMLIPLLSMTG